MYWLVENKDQLRRFQNSGYKEGYVDVVGIDQNLHPAENSISLVYIRPLDATKGFVFPISHTDTLNLTNAEVRKVLSKFDRLYTRDLKAFYHFFPSADAVCCNFPPGSYEPHITKTHKILRQRFPNLQNLNKLIPVVKHYEAFQADYENLTKCFKYNNQKYADFYKRVSLVYYNIERAGIGIDPGLFFKHFHPRDKQWVYSQYNLNTTTTRPSNKFGGVNYAALNKKTGERSAFVSRNDYFVEFDVKAYHPVIVSHLIGYDFKDSDVHESFAKMYGVSRDKAKEITFQQFYGRVFAKYKDLSYFKLLLSKQNELHSQYESQGYIEEPISGYRFEKAHLGEMNKEKLFNYFLQATESSYNVEILEQIQKILQGSSTKIVLTVYDSFLLDVKKGEENLLTQIQKVFKDKNLNTSIKSGYDYNFT